jgi:hypothetical protein
LFGLRSRLPGANEAQRIKSTMLPFVLSVSKGRLQANKAAAAAKV